ncbi:hypothetical protein [Streptomyces sp. TUS-ST3]|nr:hypothetical protein [Streptomyces sp. TUS-ST3]
MGASMATTAFIVRDSANLMDLVALGAALAGCETTIDRLPIQMR